MKSTTLFLAISAFVTTAIASTSPSPSMPPLEILPSYTNMRINTAGERSPIIKSKVTSSLARSVSESDHSAFHHLSDAIRDASARYKTRTRKRTRRPSYAIDQPQLASGSSAQTDDSLVETKTGDDSNEARRRTTQRRYGGGSKFLAT
ncbi:hypothetical protein B5807_07079 [Epicoccum nigrum]|uniref:Uncharacterized protein n=1 Tax=Epicoccum nigrum TaxID=105696 RepID=A0A1Y2LYP4_EPING|nr:hypothetical protein B5807_07079 [Epicoccum nigrum]